MSFGFASLSWSSTTSVLSLFSDLMVNSLVVVLSLVVGVKVDVLSREAVRTISII